MENPWGDDSAAEEAFERWVEERESAGDEWNEDDFVFNDSSVIEGPPLASGIYLIGHDVIASLLSDLGVSLSTIPTTYQLISRATLLNQDVKSDPTDFIRSAEILRARLLDCDWDRIELLVS